jgi:hypothetical protein
MDVANFTQTDFVLSYTNYNWISVFSHWISSITATTSAEINPTAGFVTTIDALFIGY